MTVKGGGMNEISDAAYKVFGKRKLGAAESFTPGGEGGASFIEQGFIERAVQDGFDKDTGMMTAEGIGPLPPYDWGKEYAKRNAERKGTR
jgi:hypothetical protein